MTHSFQQTCATYGRKNNTLETRAARRSAGRIIGLWLLAFAALVAAPAHANNLSCNAGTLNFTIAAGSISIPAGAVAGSTVLTLPSNTITNNCWLTTNETTTSGTIIANMATVTAPAAGFTDVYPTNIDGLGIRYTFDSDAICDTTNQTMKNKAISVSCLINGVPGGAHVYAKVIVTPSLVVTGPTQEVSPHCRVRPLCHSPTQSKTWVDHGPRRPYTQAPRAARSPPLHVPYRRSLTASRVRRSPLARLRAALGRSPAVRRSTWGSLARRVPRYRLSSPTL